jgi:hypothetical protein
MALLNPSPVLPLPVTMWVTARLFMSRKQMSETQILQRSSPLALRKPSEGSALPDTSSAATSNAVVALKALHELDLVETDDRGQFKWSLKHQPKDYATFCRQLRGAVLSSENFDGVADLKDARGARDLLRGLAWFLSKDPVAESWSWHQVYQDSSAGTDDETRIFQNATRWNGFRYWSEALGLAEVATLSSVASGALTCDVTRAVRDVVLTKFRKDEEVPTGTLLTELREQLPILPGGALSRALGHAVPGRILDRATSYALEAGQVRGWLRLVSRADSADAIQLADLDKPGVHRTISHVVVQERMDV